MGLINKIKKELQGEIEAKSAYIADGKCKTMEVYANLTGEKQGIELSLSIITQIEQKYNRGE